MMTGSNIYQNNPRYSETPKAITVSSFIGYKNDLFWTGGAQYITTVARRKRFGAGQKQSVGLPLLATCPSLMHHSCR